MSRALALVLGGVVALQVAGCEPYLFRQSDRIEIVTPRSFAAVREPLTVQWQVKDFTAGRDGSFAVFVDRDPMPPGDSIADFSPQDREGIHLMDSTSLRIQTLPPLVGVDPAEQNHHEITVVLLDTSGQRIGEYAGFTEFTVVRGP